MRAMAVCVVTLLTAGQSLALDPRRAMTQFRQTVWNTRHGLPHNTVNFIEQDEAGYLLLETFAGRVRFDGVRFEPIEPRPAPALPADFVSQLKRDVAPVFHTLTDRRGRLWVATRRGLFRRSGGVWSEVGAKEGLAPGEVRHVMEDRSGAIWFGGLDGVTVLTDAGIRRYGPADGVPPAVVRCIHEDKHGNIWIATQGAGLARLRAGRFEPLGVREGFPTDALRWIHEDVEGNLWIATAGAGIVRLSDDVFVNVTVREGLPKDTVWTVIESREGALWVGTNGGVTRLEGGAPARTYGANAGLDGLYVQSILETRDGRLLLGTQAGVFERRGERFFPVAVNPSLAHREVQGLLEDQQGAIWIATPAGASRYAGGRVQNYTAADGLGVGVRGMRAARGGGVWLATLGRGAVRFDGSRFTPVSTETAREAARDMYEDERGVLWVASPGLTRIERGQATRFQVPAATDGTVHTVLPDELGHLWLPTNHGIVRVPRADLDAYAPRGQGAIRWTVYRESEGLRSSEANGAFQPAAARTRDGRLWFATMAGLASVDPREAEPVAPTRPARIELAVTDDGRSFARGARLPAEKRRLEFRYTALFLSAPERISFRYRLDPLDSGWWEAGTRRQASYANLGPGSYRFRVAAAGADGAFREDPQPFEFAIAPFLYERPSFRAAVALALLASAASLPIMRGRRLRRRQSELTRLVDEKTLELRRQKQAIEAQARELERQNDVLAENARLKDEVERISRHDLRTPLNSVISLSRVLHGDPAIADEQKALLKQIERAGYRVLSMANLALDLYKIEQGTYLLSAAPVDVVAVAENVLLDLGALSRARKVTCEIAANGRPACTGDELLCYSMLSNLVKNAVEASPSGGRVTIGIRDADREVHVRIHNQGAIPEAVRGRFFEKYATAGKPGGSGLGAYSARLMAGAQRGAIDVRTSEASGTEVAIRLPLSSTAEAPPARESPAPPVPALPEPAHWPSLSLLVVDDSEVNRMLLGYYLEHPRFDVSFAEDGASAVELFGARRFDCVVMDLRLPGLSGLEAASRMRGLERQRGCSPSLLVALSGDEEAATRERAAAAGFDHYLQKPAERELLLRLLLGAGR
jgi:ligand-binding sensor domain-containing protein/signal transduction histidine kinase